MCGNRATENRNHRRLWAQETGFSLIETIIAVFLMGTVMVAVLGLMATTARSATRSEEAVTLQQLVRAQIETIQQSPFNEDPAGYPAISDVPEGFTVTFSSTDPGTTYTYPQPDGSTITNVIQRIVVKATGDFAEMSMTFYKVRMP